MLGLFLAVDHPTNMAAPAPTPADTTTPPPAEATAPAAPAEEPVSPRTAYRALEKERRAAERDAQRDAKRAERDKARAEKEADRERLRAEKDKERDAARYIKPLYLFFVCMSLQEFVHEVYSSVGRYLFAMFAFGVGCSLYSPQSVMRVQGCFFSSFGGRNLFHIIFEIPNILPAERRNPSNTAVQREAPPRGRAEEGRQTSSP